MIYDLSAPLTDRSGLTLTDACGAVTLASAIANALDNVTGGADTLTGTEKARRYRLGGRILANPQAVPLTLDEAALCKALVGDGYGPLIVGQVWAVLEPEMPA